MKRKSYISFWIYQADYGFAGSSKESRNSHLLLLIKRLSKLLFYKIRPVFVFDGLGVPQFKQKTLGQRQIKRHLEDLTLSRVQKRAIKQIALQKGPHGNKISSQIDDRATGIGTSEYIEVRPEKYGDLFSLPCCSNNFSQDQLKQRKDEEEIVEEVLSRDDRIERLLNSRISARGGSGLKLDEIPSDSRVFSNLQIARVLSRNKINEQLDELKREALGIACPVGNLKLMVREGLQREHIITAGDDDIEILDNTELGNKANKQEIYSFAWQKFLDENKSKQLNPIFNKAHEFKCEDLEADDGDTHLQEALLSSLGRSKQMKCCESERAGVLLFNQVDLKFMDGKNELQCDFWSDMSSVVSDDFTDVSEEPMWENESKQKGQAEELEDKNDHRGVDRSQTILDNEEISTDVESQTDWMPDYVSVHSKHISSKTDSINNAIDVNLQGGFYAEYQELLRLCGIPFIVSPGEAEAQCCELERLGLVEAVISDDSDVWLFGASKVYRNMFNQKRRLHMFTSKDALLQLGLSKWELIAIGMLSGGDYTAGLRGVGVVTALELLAEFVNDQEAAIYDEITAFKLLEHISNWINRRQDGATNNFTISPSSNSSSDEPKNGYETGNRKKLRRLLEENNDAEELRRFPSAEIFDAYVHPLVDKSVEKFIWRPVKIAELEAFAWSKLGWDEKKLSNFSQNCFRKWNEYLSPSVGGGGCSYQTHMSAFIHKFCKSEADQCLYLSNRARLALRRIAAAKNISIRDSSCLNVRDSQKANFYDDDSFNKGDPSVKKVLTNNEKISRRTAVVTEHRDKRKRGSNHTGQKQVAKRYRNCSAVKCVSVDPKLSEESSCETD